VLRSFALLLELKLQDLVLVQAREGLLVAEGSLQIGGGSILGRDNNHISAVLTRHRVWFTLVVRVLFAQNDWLIVFWLWTAGDRLGCFWSRSVSLFLLFLLFRSCRLCFLNRGRHVEAPTVIWVFTVLASFFIVWALTFRRIYISGAFKVYIANIGRGSIVSPRLKIKVLRIHCDFILIFKRFKASLRVGLLSARFSDGACIRTLVWRLAALTTYIGVGISVSICPRSSRGSFHHFFLPREGCIDDSDLRFLWILIAHNRLMKQRNVGVIVFKRPSLRSTVVKWPLLLLVAKVTRISCSC